MKTVTVPMSKTGRFMEFIRKVFIYQNNYLILISAFLLGSSDISSVLPFGAAFFAAAYGMAGIKILTAAAVIIGVITKGSLELFYINAACMVLFSVLCIPFKRKDSVTDLKMAAILFGSSAAPQIMLAALQGFLLYDVLRSLFTSFIAGVFYLIFRVAIPVMSGNVRKVLLEGEEAVGIAVTAALIVGGAGTLQLSGFSLRNILCVLLLLIFSYKCGAGAGAAAGAAIGLLISISSEYTPSVAGTYALCGMLAGILGNLGKVGAALGFVLGNMIFGIYFNGAAESMLYLRDVLVAGVLLLLMPQKLINLFTGPFARNSFLSEDRTGYSRRIRDITAERLKKFSKAFFELSRTFEEIARAKMPHENQDLNVLFDRIADRICSDCSLCMHCWERNFYDTYQVMFKIVESLEAKGRVEESDIPEHFLDKCPRINDFVNAVNNMYELFRVGVVWKSKLSECRILIGRQLEGMSRLIHSLADEINSEVSFLSPLEDAIAAALCKEGIKAKEVIAYKNPWGKYEVSIIHAACGRARNCISTLGKVISDTVGIKMVRENDGCNSDRDGNCSLKFVEAENLKLTTGIARQPKFGSQLSGDSFTFMNCGDGRFALALSDGMGTGPGAAVHSTATVNMIESFLQSGFDKDMTVSLINSILAFKSDDDNTCTIDLSIINLFNGETEFVKIGAAPTFIKKGERVDVIKSATLPAGILPGVDAELARRNVESGDMIVMVTDGIIDSFAGDDPGDRRLMKFLRETDSLNPQHIADSVLNEAIGCCGGKPCDDLTVLVAKVWERPG